MNHLHVDAHGPEHNGGYQATVTYSASERHNDGANITTRLTGSAKADTLDQAVLGAYKNLLTNYIEQLPVGIIQLARTIGANLAAHAQGYTDDTAAEQARMTPDTTDWYDAGREDRKSGVERHEAPRMTRDQHLRYAKGWDDADAELREPAPAE
jgi:hypothetical protein